MSLEIPGIVRVSEPIGPSVPIVLDVPHSGRTYPSDFKYACPYPMLRQTEDAYVDELVADATQAGMTVITALFPRAYIDLNRAEDDLDPAVVEGVWPAPLNPSERTLQGLGLIRRLCRTGVPVYARPLPVGEIEMRLKQFYRPYHHILDRTLARLQKQHGFVWHINCHSMPSAGTTLSGQAQNRADFILGDRDGTSCDPSFTRICAHLLQDMGYTVGINDPYKGMEILKRHANLGNGRQSLQLEINRALYLDEDNVERSEKFEALQKSLAIFFTRLTHDLMAQTDMRLAAE